MAKSINLWFKYIIHTNTIFFLVRPFSSKRSPFWCCSCHPKFLWRLPCECPWRPGGKVAVSCSTKKKSSNFLENGWFVWKMVRFCWTFQNLKFQHFKHFQKWQISICWFQHSRFRKFQPKKSPVSEDPDHHSSPEGRWCSQRKEQRSQHLKNICPMGLKKTQQLRWAKHQQLIVEVACIAQAGAKTCGLRVKRSWLAWFIHQQSHTITYHHIQWSLSEKCAAFCDGFTWTITWTAPACNSYLHLSCSWAAMTWGGWWSESSFLATHPDVYVHISKTGIRT